MSDAADVLPPWPLRFGAFIAPFHPTGQNPTLALQRDVELIEHLDQLGFDEAWVGEHHSGGYEIIASSEVFIATAAARTQRIKLGTGVVSLPYHHPFQVAQRIVLLDHLTRGRVMLGVGPGALPSDAWMLGIDPQLQRARMEESLEAILELFRSDEPVTRETEWFTLQGARLHLSPYSHPHPEVAVAAMISPSGPRLAGRFGLPLLSIGATQKAGFDMLGHHWDVLEERSNQFGHQPDRQGWRLVTHLHLAETREQAFADVEFGIGDYFAYFREVAALPVVPEGPPEDLANQMNESGGGMIGTPDDAIELIERLLEQSGGGFGTLLFQAHEWADSAATRRSYELFARYVMPYFQRSTDRLAQSKAWVSSKRPELLGAAGGAILGAMQQHNEEKEAAQASTPEDSSVDLST